MKANAIMNFVSRVIIDEDITSTNRKSDLLHKHLNSEMTVHWIPKPSEVFSRAKAPDCYPVTDECLI